MFLGIDLGTSSLKALVLDVDGSIVGTGSAPYPLLTPQPGWAEAEPEAWWAAAAIAVAEAAGVHASDVAAIGRMRAHDDARERLLDLVEPSRAVSLENGGASVLRACDEVVPGGA